MDPPDRFWLWWPTTGIIVLTAVFLWFMSPLGLGLRMGATGTRRQIAEGVFRFSYFILNPSMLFAWLALPLFHQRGHAVFGWSLLAFISALLVGCIAVVFALW